MKFFVPSVSDPTVAEATLRDIRTYTQDATGWLIAEGRIFSISYLDGSEVETASVGGSMFDETIECILETDLVFMVCTVADGTRLGPPIMIDKRNVVETVWFDGFAPHRRTSANRFDYGELPTGTVTFLFTDIEGSTKLWEQHPEAMRNALVRHDVLLRESIEANGGFVFKTVGDAFCAAFRTAPEALRAALEAQLDIYNEDWPEPVEIKVRMSLHTGVAVVRDGDYFGPPLNRAARLLSVAHGGQILVTEVACELSMDNLPPQAEMKSLGEFRLKDLGRPESIYQVVHPDVECEFPELQNQLNPPVEGEFYAAVRQRLAA